MEDEGAAMISEDKYELSSDINLESARPIDNGGDAIRLEGCKAKRDNKDDVDEHKVNGKDTKADCKNSSTKRRKIPEFTEIVKEDKRTQQKELELAALPASADEGYGVEGAVS
jgi:hypothetical protein